MSLPGLVLQRAPPLRRRQPCSQGELPLPAVLRCKRRLAVLDEHMDTTACRQHMRALLVDDFRGSLARTKSARAGAFVPDWRQLAVSTTQDCAYTAQRRRHIFRNWEPPEMLDAANLVIGAVYAAMPSALTEWLQTHPNRSSMDGGYTAIRTYRARHARRQLVCVAFRQFHGQGRREQVNRKPGEPLYEYLSMVLVVHAVRLLLWEFRGRLRDFRPPFPAIALSDADYSGWEHYAVRGVQEMLAIEQEELVCRDAGDDL